MTDKRIRRIDRTNTDSKFNWSAPDYAAMRNMVEDGVSYTVLTYDWANLKWELQNHEIPYWGETTNWKDREYWTTFSVHSTNGVLVCNLASSRSANRRGKAIVLLLIAGAILAIILTLLSSIVKSIL